MITIFTRDLIHRIIACVLLPLFFFQCLPCVTSQQDWEPLDDERKPMSPGGTVGIVLFSMSLFCIIFSCAMYTVCSFSSSSIETEGHEVLRSRATSGVEKEIIESFPCFPYSEVKDLKIGKGGVECAICLKDFEDEDMIRWMPPCSHTFHVNCIDEWLSSRSTCPVCRANLSLKPGDESFPYPSTDLEMGNVRRGVQESPDDISLTDANYRITRSRSTGSLSSWCMAKIFYTRSHSTGHLLVQQGKNLDRFTLQLPEEVQRELVSLNLIRRHHTSLPRAMSSRQGYKSGFSQGPSMSFSFQAASVRPTFGRENLVLETSQAKEKYFGEGSFERLMPEKV